MPQCCPQQLNPNLAPNPAISTHLVVPPLWLSLCQTLCSLQCQLWQLNPDPAPKNIALSINLVSLLPTLWMVLPVTLWMMSVMTFSLFLMYVALFWRSQILLQSHLSLKHPSEGMETPLVWSPMRQQLRLVG